MTPGAQAAAAISILSDWDSSPKTIETIMRQWGQKNRFAGSSDRAAIGEIVFDVMRNRARYAAKMKSSEPRALVIGHLSEVFAGTDWQDRFGDGPYAASEVTDEELDLGNRVQDGQDLVTCMSVPEWTLEEIEKTFGADLEQELEAMMERAPIDLRVNTLKSDSLSVRADLNGLGISAKRAKLSPNTLRIDVRKGVGPGTILNAKPYVDGRLEIQDQGAAWIVDQTMANPGDTVVDLCAGAGGKTLALAAKTHGEGRIIATDTSESRLENARPRIKKCGAKNIILKSIYPWEPREEGVDPNLENLKDSADVVLLDVPCSGSGTWRRQPDQKWRLKPDILRGHILTQRVILERGARLVKPGGELVYVTCSIFDSENRAQVERFLEQHPEFSPRRIETQSGVRQIGPGYQLSPYSTQTDGFYAAFLTRAQ